MERSDSVESRTSSSGQGLPDGLDSDIAAAEAEAEADAEALASARCDLPVVVRMHEEGWMKPDPAVRIVYNSKKATIRQHYYPEGGWGWVVVVSTAIAVAVAHGTQMSVAAALPWQLQPQRSSPSSAHLVRWPALPLQARGTRSTLYSRGGQSAARGPHRT